MLDNNATTTRQQKGHPPDDTDKLFSSPQHQQAPLKQNNFSSNEEKKSEEYVDSMIQQPPKQSLQHASPPQSLPPSKQQQQQTLPPTPTQQTSPQQQQQQQGSIPLLILCATGICTCYLSYGIFQERLFSPSYSFKKENDDGKPITTFLVLIGMFCNVFISRIWIWVESFWYGKKKEEEETTSDEEKVSLNHGLLLLTSFCYVAAMTASNESLNYASYPTVVLAKSSKLIPTMVMGYFVEHKAYSIKEWLGASMITAGIIIFNFSRMSSSASTTNDGETGGSGDSPYGLALLAFSLSMDGLLSSCQGMLKQNETKSSSNNKQQQQRQYRVPTAMETMLFINLYATFFLTPLCISSGQFSNGMDILTKSSSNPTEDGGLSAIQLIALLNGSATAGQVFIFFTIHYFSPLVCTTITTTRKFFTILLSVRNFGHVFSVVQWCSIFMVFGGLYFEIVSKNIGKGGVEKKAKKA